MSQPTEEEPIMQTIAEPLQQVLRKAAELKAQKPSNVNKTVLFRPRNRQPLATLTILNDGSRDEGEQIYLRDSKFVIGRDKGNDISIPFDADISGKHAELRCQHQKGKFRWYLIDLSSTNGTFLRGYRASLSRETELFIGSRRYKFQLPDHHDELAATNALQTQMYQSPSPAMMEQFVPRLTEVGTAKEKPRAFSIGGTEANIGRDSACQIAIQDDPFLNPKHARFYQDERGRWMIDDRKSLNGVWIRVKRMALDQPAEFQLGQQQFRFVPNIS